MPRIVKRLDLGCRFRSILLGEQDAVFGLGVEGWIEVDQIDRLVIDVAAKNIEVIPEVKMVHGIPFNTGWS